MSSSEHSQEEEFSSMSVGSRGLPPLPNSDHYNLIRQRLDRYRRGSEGNFTSPTEIILRIPPRLPGNLATRMDRQRVCRPRPLNEDLRSISPNDATGRPRSSSLDVDDVPLSVSQMYNPDENDSGSSTPASSVSRRSSVSSCSELISALESVMADLQASQAEIEDAVYPADSAITEETKDASTTTGTTTKATEGSEVKREASLEKAPSHDLGKAWKTDLAEKEKLLNECKNQIRTLSSSKQQLERTCEEQKDQLEYAMGFKIPSKYPLKRWPTNTKGNVYDVLNPLNLDDVYSEPREIINVLIESERRYISGLSLLHTHFEKPLRMLAVFKPDILSSQQMSFLFLNCSELLILHRSFYEELCDISSMSSQTAQVDKLLEVCERVFQSFSIYSPFMDSSRKQNIQKEMKILGQKPQFTQLLVHCQKSCKDVNFMDLLLLPTERLNKYSDFLKYFLDPRVRALPEDATKRAEAIIRFLRNLRFELLDEKSDLDHMKEKVKLLQKFQQDCPIPLEIFDSDVHLVKQGSLIQVVGKKETQRMCFLFNRYIAVAESVTPTQYRFLEHGMIPLSGAQLHKSVDIEGQALQPDLKSGRQEDRLAFRLSFVNNESLYFRVARPNELKGWVERLEKSIQESQQAHEQPEAEEFCLYPADIGPKIAAASLEKLFQQLTSPQIFREDFTDVFLLTHSCFTTAKEVLTALVNCVKSYEDSMSDTSSQTSGNYAFPFSMDELSPCVSASPSSYNLHIDSEGGSPTPGGNWNGTSVSPSSPTPSPSNLQRSGALDPSERKAVLSGSSFVSSSTDSETSPHTSAVVDGNPLAGGMKNGWIEDQYVSSKRASKDLPSGDADADAYSRLIPRERVHIGSAESEGEECDGEETPRNVSLSGSTGGGHLPKAQNKGNTSLQLESEAVAGTTDNASRTSNMFQELDESSQMLDMLTESLNIDFKYKSPTPPTSTTHERRRLSHSASNASSVFSENEDIDHMTRAQEAAANGVQRRSRTLSENAARHQLVSNLSTSEPDLPNMDDVPPPIPPRDPDMLAQTTPTHELRPQGLTIGNRMVRGSSEHSLLTASLSVGPGQQSPFHHGNAMMIGLNPRQTRSALSTPERKKNSNTIDNSGSRTPKKLVVGKKSSTFGRYSPVSDSPEKAVKKEKAKRRWVGVKHKISKTFKRSPSMEVKDTVTPREARSQSIPSIRRNNIGSLTRKTSVGPEVMLSVAVDVPDGGGGLSPSRRPRAVSVQGSAVTLIAKIFSVLKCWQENYCEDFEEDSELRQYLEDFLQNIIDKSPTDSAEYFGALSLLESMSNRKPQSADGPTKMPTFLDLLQRVTNVEPDMLKRYDWEHPDKLMVGKEIIDLGRSHPKDTVFHKVVAEQLTLMEFAVYAAVQRRELLKCAWKKPDKETQAPNLCRLIRRTNEMTSWVSTEILSRETPSQRARVIENFIQIAHHCYSHNDFHCALNITIALGSACIKSLRHTWEEVEKKQKSRLEKLRNQVDYHGRCKKMREKLEKITEESLQRAKLPNALPYIGAYLDQIYSLEMNSKTYNPDGLVNFAKMTKLAQMIQNVLQYQRSNFGFVPRLDVMAYVTAAKRHSENELYELSTKREPHSH